MRSIAIVWVSLFLATACVASTDLPEFPFVCTSGDAALRIMPDGAAISFKLSCFDADSEQGMKALEAQAGQIVRIMDEFSIATENAKAFAVTKSEIREEIGEWQKGEIIGYRLEQRFTFRLKGLDTYQKIAQRLVKTDNVVDVSVDFTLTDRGKREQELVQKAIANARENAERIARGAGARLGAVHALSDVDLRDLSRHFLRTTSVGTGAVSRRSASRGRGASVVDTSAVLREISKPSPITLQASIRVLYRIKPGDPS